MNALARTLWLRGSPDALDEAQKLQSRALELARTIEGKQSPTIARSLDLLACIVRDRGQLDEAIALFRQALAMRSAIQSPDHPETAGEMSQLADALARAGQAPEAIDLAKRGSTFAPKRSPRATG